MKERNIFWRVVVFLIFYVVFLVLVNVLSSFAATQDWELGAFSMLAFALTALATSRVLMKKSLIRAEKINKISIELAVVTLLFPIAVGLLFSVLGFLFGVNLFGHILSAWQTAGISALIVQIENQVWDALIVFVVMKYSLEGRLFWKKA